MNHSLSTSFLCLRFLFPPFLFFCIPWTLQPTYKCLAVLLSDFQLPVANRRLQKKTGRGGEMSLGVLSPSFSSICRKFHLLWWLQWQLQKAGVTLEAVGSVITTTTEAASTNHLPPPRAQPAGSAMSSVLVTVCHSQGWLTVSWTYQSPLGCLAFSFCSFRSFKAITSSSLNQIS